MTGVDGVGKVPHSLEHGKFPLLAHDVLDTLRKSGIIPVAEHGFVPTSADSEAVELDVILDNVLVVLQFEVIGTVFGISSGVKLGAEYTCEF